MKNKVVYPLSIKDAAPIQPYVQVNIKKEIKTNLNVFLLSVVFINALSTGDKTYKSKYALINQLSLVAKMQPARPFVDSSFTPISTVIKYRRVSSYCYPK